MLENSQALEQFRIISLLSVEYKIFLSIWLGYTDTLVQKCCTKCTQLFGTPGCIATEQIKGIQEGKGDLVVLGLT